jgi:hypothetical protein
MRIGVAEPYPAFVVSFRRWSSSRGQQQLLGAARGHREYHLAARTVGTVTGTRFAVASPLEKLRFEVVGPEERGGAR